jgi:DNA-binding winged helix-turn-helix (wHTH) protein
LFDLVQSGKAMPDAVEHAPISSNEAVRLGEWTVEPALNRLSRAGKTVKLEPKAMALLRYLVERPGEVVSREALLSAVWPGVVVGDDSLTQAIIKLRKALGDVAESPAYIQTISKGGYRLIAPVVPAGTDVRPAAPLDLAPARAESRLPVRWLALTGMTLLVVMATGVWWLTGAGWGVVSPDPMTSVKAEAARAAQPTVSITPFEAVGDDSQAVLLAQGITADLVTDLSKVFGLSVISPARLNTSEDAGNAVAPRYLVSGTVQHVEDRLRL